MRHFHFPHHPGRDLRNDAAALLTALEEAAEIAG
jgi:hypothetical protein